MIDAVQTLSRIHPGKQFTPCVRCGARGLVKYAQPKTWKDTAGFEALKQAEPELHVTDGRVADRPAHVIIFRVCVH